MIFGEDLAACLAAHEIRKVKRREEVVIVRASRSVGYSRSLLPYYAADLVDRTELVPRALLEVVDLVSVVSSRDVTFYGDQVSVEGRSYAKPKVLMSLWPSLSRENAINLLTPEDAEELREALRGAKEVSVAGGLAALPVVDALVTAGWRVSLLWRCEEFDSDIEAVLVSELQKGGNVRLVSELPSLPSTQPLVNFGDGQPPDLPFGCKPSGNAVPVDSGCRVVGSDLYAIGLATQVVEPEGFRHNVRCEEEVILQAMNFADRDAGAPFPPLRRYFVARYGNRIYASFGLTMREAEAMGYDAAATRIRGWGKLRDVLVKAVSSRDGCLIGLQVVAGEELSCMLGLLYLLVLSKAKLHELSRAINPIDPHSPAFEGVFDKAFKALMRKSILRRLAKTSQRLECSLGSAF